MQTIEMLRCKLHKARVTDANVDYEGSLTLDPELRNAAGFLVHEKILVANFTNGKRFETYLIEGEPGSGDVCLNGGTAHLGEIGDILMIASFARMSLEEAQSFSPKVVILNEDNSIKELQAAH